MGKPYKDLPMVGVAGFEPAASWTRTMRDTKLRHTPIPANYNEKHRDCQGETREFWCRNRSVARNGATIGFLVREVEEGSA